MFSSIRSFWRQPMHYFTSVFCAGCIPLCSQETFDWSQSSIARTTTSGKITLQNFFWRTLEPLWCNKVVKVSLSLVYRLLGAICGIHRHILISDQGCNVQDVLWNPSVLIIFLCQENVTGNVTWGDLLMTLVKLSLANIRIGWFL